MANESITNRLSELFELHKSGAITTEEFEKLKSQLINEGGSRNKTPEKQSETEAVKIPGTSDQKEYGNKIWIFSIIVVVLIIAGFIVIRGVKGKNVIWDDVVATNRITEELKKHSWDNNFTGTSPINHRIVRFETISLSGKDIIVGLTLSNNTSETAGIPSVFEFANRNGWKIVRKEVGFGDFMEDLTINKIESDNYCIISSRSEGGMGRSWEYKVIYVFIKGKFKQIFETPYDMRFITRSEGYYDIEATPRGGVPETYKFNGDEYVKQ